MKQTNNGLGYSPINIFRMLLTSENYTFKGRLICSIKSEVLYAVRHGSSHDQPVNDLKTTRPVIERRHPLANPHDIAEHFDILNYDWNADQCTFGLLRCFS